MTLGPYNPQEVLAPLLQRFGRHLHGDRDTGFEQMVSAVCEELRVDVEHARSLLRHLECSGLIVFEALVMPAGQGAVIWQDKPASGSPARRGGPAAGVTAWRIGPCV